MPNDVDWHAVAPVAFGVSAPKPDLWDSHPSWFHSDGRAARIPGPRHVPDDGKPWYWGPTEYVREIGPYTVLCFRWDYSRHSFGSQEEHGRIGFAAWVDGVEVDTSWDTLDECIVDMVRFKHEGARSSSGPRATEYFLRMIQA